MQCDDSPFDVIQITHFISLPSLSSAAVVASIVATTERDRVIRSFRWKDWFDANEIWRGWEIEMWQAVCVSPLVLWRRILSSSWIPFDKRLCFSRISSSISHKPILTEQIMYEFLLIHWQPTCCKTKKFLFPLNLTTPTCFSFSFRTRNSLG